MRTVINLNTWLVMSVFLLWMLGLAAGEVIYVDVNGPNDPGAGSYEDPFRKIQYAIDAATDGDIIEVRPGLYTGQGNYDLDPNGLAITIRSTDPNDPNAVANTIIDPNGAGRGFYFHSGEDINCVVAGFTLQNGATDGSGGAMYCFDSSPTIRNCVIIKNTATWSGGGIYFFNSESTIRNCIIAGNSVLATGGGVRCVSCSNFAIINCTISGNSAGWQQGEGIYCFDSTVSINNSIIWGNGLEQLRAVGRHATVTYSDVQNGWSGTGNIDTDPCFVTGPWGDFYLSQVAAGQLVDSPCVDTGSDLASVFGLDEFTTRTDHVGDAGIVDMGYHYAPPANTTPVACIVGGDRTIEATGLEIRVTLDGSGSSDADSTPGTNDDIVSFDWYKVDACDPNFEDFIGSGEIIDCNLPLGEHIIVLEVTDKAGAFDTNEVTIIVQDTTPPDFTLSVTPTMLWPVSHKMVLITLSWRVSDICDESPEVSLVSITMNEDDEATGDGHTTDDIQVDDNGLIYLRAERSGAGSGRIYTITYQAVDDSGNVAVARATVTVPHDQR